MEQKNYLSKQEREEAKEKRINGMFWNGIMAVVFLTLGASALNASEYVSAFFFLLIGIMSSVWFFKHYHKK
jgi:hypothetical protein